MKGRQRGLPPVSLTDDDRDGRGTTPRATGLDAYDRPAAADRDAS